MVRAGALESILGPIADSPQRLGKALLAELDGLQSAGRGAHRIVFDILEDGQVVLANRAQRCRDRSHRPEVAGAVRRRRGVAAGVPRHSACLLRSGAAGILPRSAGRDRFQSEEPMTDSSTPEGATLALVSLLEAGDLDGVMDLYEEGAVFVDLEGEVRGDGIREAHRRFMDEGNRLVLRRSVVYEANGVALVHWDWEVSLRDGSSIEGVSAEVLRRQPDGNWRFVIDNSDGEDVLAAPG
jgi:ketosteroid isomerase-like protein